MTELQNRMIKALGTTRDILSEKSLKDLTREESSLLLDIHGILNTNLSSPELQVVTESEQATQNKEVIQLLKEIEYNTRPYHN